MATEGEAKQSEGTLPTDDNACAQFKICLLKNVGAVMDQMFNSLLIDLGIQLSSKCEQSDFFIEQKVLFIVPNNRERYWMRKCMKWQERVEEFHKWLISELRGERFKNYFRIIGAQTTCMAFHPYLDLQFV